MYYRGIELVTQPTAQSIVFIVFSWIKSTCLPASYSYPRQCLAAYIRCVGSCFALAVDL